MIHFFGKKNKIIFTVESTSILDKESLNRLSWLFDFPYLGNNSIKGNYFGPRPTMVSPWSTNAVEITQNMGVNNISRVEKYLFKDPDLNFDLMLHQNFKELNQKIFRLKGIAKPILKN